MSKIKIKIKDNKKKKESKKIKKLVNKKIKGVAPITEDRYIFFSLVTLFNKRLVANNIM